MTSMTLAAVFLLLSHFISSTPVRPWAVRRLGGEGPWLGLYTLVALFAFGWLIQAWRTAPVVWIFAPSVGVQHAVVGLMPVPVFLVVAAVLAPNPALVGRDGLLHREPVGILRVTRHPMLWGVGLWASLHMAANPDVASWLMFGALAVLSFAGTVLQDHKKRRDVGDPWCQWEEATSNVPFVALAQGRTPWRADGGLLWQFPVAIGAYGLLIVAHPWLAGIAVWPG